MLCTIKMLQPSWVIYIYTCAHAGESTKQVIAHCLPVWGQEHGSVFPEGENTQCGYHQGFSSLMDPLVLKMRRLRLEDSPQDRELLRLTPQLTRGQPRKWPLARQMQDSESPTWGQIKILMDMVTMVTSSLGMTGNPTATLLAPLVIITIQVGVVQGDAYWTFMPNLPMVHAMTW
jgi:hypothetical protein